MFASIIYSKLTANGPKLYNAYESGKCLDWTNILSINIPVPYSTLDSYSTHSRSRHSTWLFHFCLASGDLLFEKKITTEISWWMKYFFPKKKRTKKSSNKDEASNFSARVDRNGLIQMIWIKTWSVLCRI